MAMSFDNRRRFEARRRRERPGPFSGDGFCGTCGPASVAKTDVPFLEEVPLPMMNTSRSKMSTPRRASPRTAAMAMAVAVGLAATIVLMGLLPGRARADVAAEAETAITAGIELRRQGQDRAALAEFQRAVRLRETPRAIAQMGLAEQALGLWMDANTHVGRALDARDDPWIRKNRATLETARTTIQSHLAQVEVWGAPSGAEVRLDGVLVGTLPSVTAWVGTGEVSMAVTAPGHAPLTRLVTIPAAGRSREHAQLRVLPAITKVPELVAPEASAPPAPALAEPSGVRGVTASDEKPGGTPPDGPPAAESTLDPIYKKWWFWAAIGAVTIGTGAGIYVLTRDSSRCAVPPCDSF